MIEIITIPISFYNILSKVIIGGSFMKKSYNFQAIWCLVPGFSYHAFIRFIHLQGSGFG